MDYSNPISLFWWPDGSYLEKWFPFSDFTYVLGSIIAVCLFLKLFHFVSGSIFSIGRGAGLFH